MTIGPEISETACPTGLRFERMHNSGRKLLLHIGTHKTGTSSIQKALYENQACLDDLGYKFYFRGKGGVDRKTGISGGWFDRNEDPRDGLRLSKELAETLGNTEGNILFCQENLSWVFSRETIQSFHEELKKHFEHISIVIYIRRQDKLAISHHQQGSKSTEFFSSVFYGSENKALPSYQDYFQKYLNFHERIALWTDAFGKDQVQPRVFDKKYLFGEDVVSDFFNMLGATETIRTDWVNESNGFVRTKVNHLFNRIDMERHRREKLNRRLDNSGRLAPLRQEATDFYSHFRESNCKLNQQFNLTPEEFLFDDDFSSYPNAPGDEWTEDSANDAILSLLVGIKSIPAIWQGNANILLQCISVLKEIDIQSASELQQLYDKYYPDHARPGLSRSFRDRSARMSRKIMSLLTNS